MNRIALINVVGLAPRFLDDRMPRLRDFASAGRAVPIETITPAVTCSVQSTMLTDAMPSGHGIVANGWWDREFAEPRFWKQSNQLVQGEKIWDIAKQRDASFTCANLFWWFNMYSGADIAVTPRPMYPADGRKIPDIWTNPPALRDELQSELGQFPLFKFWGPMAGIESSAWIAECAKIVEQQHSPTLSLVYLPHLDYNLQRLGPDDARIDDDLRAIDTVTGDLIDHYIARGVTPIILSEYGVTPVSRPIHINRALREAGLLAVRDELGREIPDFAAGAAFAIADHQIAHIYINHVNRTDEVRTLVESLPGVEVVLDDEGKRARGLDHPRSGDLIAISDADAWFTYDFWLEDDNAPDYARTVDIHRKPGYDPRELFIDPNLTAPKARIALKLLKKRLGFRTLLDVIPLDATLVKGSHGRPTDNPNDGPVLITPRADAVSGESVQASDVRDIALKHVFAR